MLEIAKKCGEMWKGLDEADKEPYTKMWKIDQQRFEKQTKEFESNGFILNEDGTKAIETDPKKKYGKDVVLPKKVKSAYTYFASSNLRLIMSKSEGKPKAGDAMKDCGKKWKEIKSSELDKINTMILENNIQLISIN